jgi:hypothetical protein
MTTSNLLPATILAAGLLGAAALLRAPTPAAAQTRDAWEYRYAAGEGGNPPSKPVTESQCNALGVEGWELCGSIQAGGYTTYTIFRRRR